MAEAASLVAWDIVAIVAYFVIVFGVGIVATCRAKTGSAAGFFLAGKSTTWIPIGASTYSTNIGAPMFVGLAGSAAAGGIAVVMFEWHAMFMLILLGWFFLPVYLSSGCFTMPQYLQLRFGGQRIRIWLAVVFTFQVIVNRLAAQLYAGVLFIQRVLNWNMYGAVLLILAFTVFYTAIGGLTAVIWTDTIQTAILVIGSFALAGITLNKVGGFNAMREQYQWAAANYTYRDQALYGNRSCGLARPDAWHIFRDVNADQPWPGLVFGLTILALNAWCTDQICVQRSLSAKNMSHAKAGVLLAAYLKILPFLFFIIPGMISRILYPNEVACADPDECRSICGNPSGCTNIAYPLLVIRELPNGVRGVMLAALLAALMSSLTSIFNSACTVFSVDICGRIRKRAGEQELLIVSRLFTLVLVVVSVVWLPILEQLQGSQLWNYQQSIVSYLVPPIVAVFLMGLLWPRATEEGAFAALVVGLGCGIIRMGLHWSRLTPPCGGNSPDTRFLVVTRVHYLHFAIILAVVSAFVCFCVSLVTQPRPPEKLRRVTWWTRNESELQELSHNEQEEILGQSRDQIDLSRIESKPIRWFWKYICGVDENPAPQMTKEEWTVLQKKMTSINEDPFWKKVLDVNAIICAAVAIFLHAFWA